MLDYFLICVADFIRNQLKLGKPSAFLVGAEKSYGRRKVYLDGCVEKFHELQICAEYAGKGRYKDPTYQFA